MEVEVKRIMTVENMGMLENIDSIPTMTEAFRVSVRHAGLKDKQVSWELDMKPQQWSLIMSGQAHFPHEKYTKFFEIVRNHIPLQWLAAKCGYELRVMPKTLEEELKKEKEEKEKLQEKIAYLESLIFAKREVENVC